MSTFPDFIQAVLTDKSKEDLYNVLSGGLFDKKYMHHVTLAFKPNQEDYKEVVFSVDPPLENKTPVKIKIGRRIYDEDFGVEAVTAKVFTENGQEIKSLNNNPHITISTKENRKPVESNDLLSSVPHHKFNSIPLVLDGHIEFGKFGKNG